MHTQWPYRLLKGLQSLWANWRWIFYWNRLWHKGRIKLKRQGTLGKALLVPLDAFAVVWNRDGFTYAASMAFFTLFSLVPLMFLISALLVKVANFTLEDVSELLQTLALSYLLPEQSGHILGLFLGFAENLLKELRNVSYLSVGVLVYNAYSLIYQLSAVMNKIWRSEGRRSFWVDLLWNIGGLLLLPMLLITGNFTAVWASSLLKLSKVLLPVVASQSIANHLEMLAGSVIQLVHLLITLGFQAAAFALFFYFMPAAKKRFISALVGAVAAVGLSYGLSLGFSVFFTLVEKRYGLFYGTFASIILFMLWLYVFWFMVIYSVAISHVFHRIFPFKGTKGDGPLSPRL